MLEVGIGGTYDSTNLVPRPIVTGVTALGLDHTAVLGNTVEEIAKNKAGIYKTGVPALSVPQDHAGGLAVLRETAQDVGAPFEVVPLIPADVPLGLKGDHQRINASLAVAMAKKFLESRGKAVEEGVLPKSFEKPLRETRWPGRCQKIEHEGVRWMLDGAHTVESLTSCGQWAWAEGTPKTLIFNCSGGRAGESLLGALLAAGSETTGQSVQKLGEGFEQVIFCTNVTYTSGEFKGGECNSDFIYVGGVADLRPDFESDRPRRPVSTRHSARVERRLAQARSVLRICQRTCRAKYRACRQARSSRRQRRGCACRWEFAPRWGCNGSGWPTGLFGHGMTMVNDI